VSEFELLSTKVNLNGAALRLQMNDRHVLERIHLADDDSHADEPHIHKCSTWGHRREESSMYSDERYTCRINSTSDEFALSNPPQDHQTGVDQPRDLSTSKKTTIRRDWRRPVSRKHGKGSF
jgi:hypothetical protein